MCTWQSYEFIMILLYLFQQKALEAAMNDINSSFGKGSVTRLGSAGGALVYVFSNNLYFVHFFPFVTLFPIHCVKCLV